MSVDIQEMTKQILVEGFCILRDQFPIPAIEACNEAFAPILRDYVAEHADNPNRGPCRHYITLPFEPPLYNPCFFDDNTVIAIASQILGEDFVIDQYASDTPLKGSVYQEIHGDVGPLFRENPDFQHPPAILAVNFPFVDVTPAHGPFEVACGTHLLPKAEALRQIEDGEIPLEPLVDECRRCPHPRPALSSPRDTQSHRYPASCCGICMSPWLDAARTPGTEPGS